MRFFLQISYRGFKYRGWQKQDNTDNCIQEIIENAINKTLNSNYSIIGCGRTDAGVHAKEFFAHIDTTDNAIKIKLAIINLNLPSDIVIERVIPVPVDLHARYDAKFRTYEYHMHFYKDAFLFDRSTYFDYKTLDWEMMNKACEIACKYQDFKSFCKTPQRNKNNLCYNVTCKIQYIQEERRGIFVIRASRFLKSMVRILVYDLLQIGLGLMTLEEFENLFIEGRVEEVKLVPPQGLFLVKVEYDIDLG